MGTLAPPEGRGNLKPSLKGPLFFRPYFLAVTNAGQKVGSHRAAVADIDANLASFEAIKRPLHEESNY
jgi:hypothetical protein